MFGLFKNNVNLSQLPQQAQQISSMAPLGTGAPTLKQPQGFGSMFNNRGGEMNIQPVTSYPGRPYAAGPAMMGSGGPQHSWFDGPDLGRHGGAGRIGGAHEQMLPQNSFEQYAAGPNGTVRRSIPRSPFPGGGPGNGAF